MPADILIQLQKMLVYVDIPNFFCLVITNDTKMQAELDYVCLHHAVNENPIKSIFHNTSIYLTRHGQDSQCR